MQLTKTPDANLADINYELIQIRSLLMAIVESTLSEEQVKKIKEDFIFKVNTAIS